MRKSTLLSVAAALSMAFAFAPSSEAAMAAKMGAMAPMKCDDASMTKMETDMGAMPDGPKKTMAMKEMGMAKDAMMKKKMKTCANHMMKAGKSMM